MMNAIYEKFKRFYMKHKMFALSLPVVLILSVFYVSSMFALEEKKVDDEPESGYNTEIPYEEKEMKVKNNVEISKDRLNDSLSKVDYQNRTVGNIDMKDSSVSEYEEAYKDLEEFSFKEGITEKNSDKEAVSSGGYYNNSGGNFLDRRKKEGRYSDESEEPEEEEESDPIVVYTPEKKEEKPATNKNEGANRTYAAKIAGSQTVTKSSPMVSIIIMEELPLGDVVLPKYTYVSAVASFDESRVYLNISSVRVNKDVYSTDIVILDRNGYEGIPVKGGTGAKAQETVADDTVNEIVSETPVGQIPGSRGLRRIFDKKAKAKLNSDKIRLKIRE